MKKIGGIGYHHTTCENVTINMVHVITLERKSLRRTDQSKLRFQLQKIVDKGIGGPRGRQGWRLKGDVPQTIEPQADPTQGWAYSIPLEFERIGKPVDPPVEETQFAVVLDYVAKAAAPNGNWYIPGYAQAQNGRAVTLNNIDVIAEIDIEKGTHFDNLYGLDAQIDVVLASLRVAKATRYSKRYHTVLHGSPGCGKSELLRCVKSMAGVDGVLEFDGTQTTAAGAINSLMDAEALPAVIIIEEIEKVPDAPFMWLLGVLDSRGEVRKINNNGTRQRKIPSICLATVNDLDLFKSRHEGAMASRFAHQLYCPRPTDPVLRKILRREVASIDGNPEWIEPAVRYCIDEEGNHDPRRVIAVCLTGQDKLLDKSFQKALLACRQKEK